MHNNQDIMIRPIEEKDLPRLWELIFKEEAPEWKKWDAPYYPHKSMPYEEFAKRADEWVRQPYRMAVELNGEVIGMVSYYWEHEPSMWLEAGIILFESHNWGKGIGTEILKKWISYLFQNMPLVRVGYTTWSGNHRMIRVGEKLGMQLEARIRKVRYYNGQYYDSIRMGVLREEWESMHGNK